VAALALYVAARPRQVAPALATLATLGLGAVLVAGTWAVHRIDCCWPAVRERLVTRASQELANTLSGAVAGARALAEAGAGIAARPPADAFAEAAAATRRGPRGIERGIVVLGADGASTVWAGRHRFVPAPDTTELRAVITPFYVSLEARRQTTAGGWSVGSVLLATAPAAPDQGRSLAAVFAARHGVGLRFFPPRLAPSGSDVFDYTPKPRPDTIFSVLTEPPTQSGARAAALGQASRLASLALGATLILLLVAAPPGAGRWGVALTGAWCLVSAPLGETGTLGALFSPVTFYRPMLGVFSASAGSLSVLAALTLFGAGVLWRRGLERRWWSYAAAAVLVFEAPYLVRDLGRGIRPPAQGVSIPLWLSWETTLAVTSMALILLAAALVRGPTEPRRASWILPAASLWAAVAALAGLWLWEPNGAWPDWYTFVWLPALAGVLVPAPRRWAVVSIATVAGTAAALVTWGATVEGRIGLADRDARGIGGAGDRVTVAALQRLGQQASNGIPPRTAGDLYALWTGSTLATADYPAVLQLWTGSGDLLADLPLAALDLRPALLAALARSARTGTGQRIERVDAVPGVHYVLITPLDEGEVLVVGVGPRSRLVPATRVARFLHQGRENEGLVAPPYAISLTPPTEIEHAPAPSESVVWTRDGWSARGERRVELPGGARHVHVRVDLPGPWPLLVRGALVVAVDVALLAVCWLVSVALSQAWRPGLPSLVTAWRASFRLRLAVALAAFFVLPMLAFASWSFTRLSEQARDAGDLLIGQALKDAAGVAATLPLDRPDAIQHAVLDLGQRLDADLWLYRGGVLAGTSTPVFSELGLVDPYLSGDVYRRVALEDELDLTTDGRTSVRPVRVGYRVVVAGPPRQQLVLAAPQLLDDERAGRQREDLALTVLFAACLGVAAALLLADVAARGLARPVAALREAADAVGRGAPPPPFPVGAPREFSPVMRAFERMAADVRASATALEDARRRTAQVLANVATGVIAVDEDLHVATANARAAELVGRPLDPGTALEQGQGSDGDWQPVWTLVRGFVARGARDIVEREFAIGRRQIRVQIAPLGTEPGQRGGVVALDDTTAPTRAARVLAWGEMARQVAHEIKNPLTPIRLGIQHLQRARRSDPGFDATLNDTARRVLAEIDRLDAIARAFSRFASPGAEALPLEAVDLHAVASEVAQLYALGGPEEATGVALAGAPGPRVRARRDELKEVLINLLENARNAGAQRVVVRIEADGLGVAVEDDGHGIAPDVLPRVFDPAFSTTSSGSGLGLAIARRLVESWGGAIALSSVVGRGTRVAITFRAWEA
jgi:signal transduction histidine kinase